MTANVDGSNISYSTMSTIGPTSTLESDTSDTYYDNGITGCMRKCPCRLWAQCSYYNVSKWKESRGDEDSTWEEINNWYETFFKYKPEMPDITYPNG